MREGKRGGRRRRRQRRRRNRKELRHESMKTRKRVRRRRSRGGRFVTLFANTTRALMFTPFTYVIKCLLMS